MTWQPLPRNDFRFDFEDWRFAESSETSPTEPADGSTVIFTSREIAAILSKDSTLGYSYFWSQAEEINKSWSGSDDEAQGVDSVLRQLAQFGNPEAIYLLAQYSLQLEKVDESARWVNRLRFLTKSIDHMVTMPEGEDPEGYLAYLQSQLQEFAQIYFDHVGQYPPTFAVEDVGPKTRYFYCITCGMQLEAGNKTATCDRFFYNCLMEWSEEKVAETPDYVASHGHQIGGSFERWPNGVPGKFRWSGSDEVMIPDF